MVNRAAEAFDGRRVLVSGAAGFIGRPLTAALSTAGADVSIIDSSNADLEWTTNLKARVDVHLVDIRDREQIPAVVRSSAPEYVFHLAAVGVANPFVSLDLALAVNLHGTLNLLRACFQASPTGQTPIRFVHAGTPYEYGERGGKGQQPSPINHYAASKAAAFALVRMFNRVEGWPLLTVRPYQVYGPGQPDGALIPSAVRSALAGEPFRMTAGEQRRDLVYVDDIVCGFLLAGANGIPGHSYDLGWGQSYSLRQVIERLFALLHVEAQPTFGALPYRPGEIWEMVANPVPAATELGWEPKVDLDEGLIRTADQISYSR